MFWKVAKHLRTETTAEQGPQLLPVILVTLLEVDEADHPAILEHLHSRLHNRHKLVFLLSTDNFAPFLRYAAAFETFPSSDQQARHRRLIDWPGYLTEKWELLLLKWRPENVLSYGTNPDRFLAQARITAGRTAQDRFK
ncbi:MAG: hypothetical protein ABIR04_11360 [Cypionkella sp.]